MTPLESAWLAGLYEGEGCADAPRGNPRVRIKMSDLDIVLRARALMNGTLYEDKWNARHRGLKDLYVAQVTGARAALVIETILPYLGTRRSARAADILFTYRERGQR